MALNKISKLSSQVSTTSGTVPVYKSLPNVDKRVEVITNLRTLDNNVTIANTTVDNVFYTSKLLNYVEPAVVSGIQKTAFFTELSTNFNAGDRVFILDGFYDSDDFIQKNKYVKFTDGYRVLGVDGCKVILNIDYTGQLPYTDSNLEDLIFVHNITSQEQFNYINTMTIGLSYSIVNSQSSTTLYSSFSGRRYTNPSKADLYGGNIIFVGPNTSFSSSNDSDLLFTNGALGGSTGTFYMKSSSSLSWINISDQFNANKFRIVNPLTNPTLSTGNKKIVVLGEDFTYGGITFKERCIYKFSTEKKTWIFDKTYKQPIISKLNFRGGLFKGTHKDGIFGSYDKVVKWNNAVWNSGFLINSNWIAGSMNSKSVSGTRNYVARLSVDTNGSRIALQNTDTSNNRGFGYNYTIDSTIRESIIKNGNFENSNIGISYSTISIDNYYNNTATHSVTISGGNFIFCDVNSSLIQRSTVNDSIIKNSILKQTRSISNQIIDSVATKVDYSSDGGLQILGADLYSYYKSTNTSITDYTDVRGVLKLFISDRDFLRMEKGDSFYLEKVNKDVFLSSLSIDQKILLPVETRYLLDYYTDWEKSGNKISVSLKGKNENKYKHYLKLVSIPSYQTSYSPTYTDTTYWVNPTPNGSQVFNEPTVWIRNNQPYNEYDLVVYTANGQTKIYYYLGNDGEGPGNTEQILTDPTDSGKNGPLGGLWWEEVGIYKDEWVSTADLNPSTNDVYYYVEPNTGNIVYIKRTSTLGDGYRTSKFLQVGSADSRSLVVKDSDFNACSIDLDSLLFGFYEKVNGERVYTSTGLSGIPITRLNEAFGDTYIKPSDFRSGLFIDSKWISGYNLNHYPNVIQKADEYNLAISYNAPNSLRVRLNNNPFDSKFKKQGLDIVKDDYVWLNGVAYQNGSTTIKLDGKYIVLSSPNVVQSGTDNFIEVSIRPVDFTLSNLSNISATFSSIGAEDANYVTLSKLSIQKSTIISGFFRRTQFSNSFITNPLFDNTNKDFPISNTNILRLVNIVSSGNNVTIEDGVHYKSHLVDPTFNNGILYESVWNGGTFSTGIIISSYWKNGNFLSGILRDSFATSPDATDFSSSLLYKSWIGGKFQSGEFYNSVWLDGTFNNGRFYFSNFYGGIWNNGVLGSSQLKTSDTTFGHYAKLPDIGATSAIWNDGTVENALMGGDGIVYWYNGKYVSGEFTSYGSDPTKESIWYNGDFYGSKFTNLARWKNGTFNNGKFYSYYGWENVGPVVSSTNPSDYSWESGKFMNGEFGYKGLTANSTWCNGQFLNGIFQGRFWNSGYFIGGDFYGSGSFSATPSSVSNYGEFTFADSFRTNYYGLWNSGIVIDNVAEAPLDGRVLTNRSRATDPESTAFGKKTTLNNILWMGGTFSHKFGILKDSLFLNGSFYNGQFDGGVFNPYVDRLFLGSESNTSFSTNTKWYSGDFITGSFWASEWMKGRFYSGYMSGAKWNDGIWYYGTAENILWLDGTWKNGNWNGSPYDYNLISPTESYLFIEGTGTESGGFGTISRYIMNDGREKDVIYKVSEYNDFNNNVHLLNIFSASTPITFTADAFTNSRSWTHSAETYIGMVENSYTIGKNQYKKPTLGILNSSTWVVFGSFELVKETIPASYLNANGAVVQTKRPKPNSITGKSTLTISDANLSTFGGGLSFVGSNPILGYNFYNTDYRSSDSAVSRKLYAFKGGTTSIFTQTSRKYDVKLTLAVELAPTVEVQVYVGSLSYSTYTLASDAYKYTEFNGNKSTQYEDYYSKVYTINITYNTSTDNISTLEGQQLWIKKTSNGILRLLKADITYQILEYNSEYNNRLYSSINRELNSVDFPTYSVALNAASGNGREVGANFGNGVFAKGIWENGVWNNGYRSLSRVDGWNQDDSSKNDDIIKAFNIDSKETYKISDKTWRVSLDIINNTGLSSLNKNKKVSVGNIVGISINNTRVFFRDAVDIISIDGQNNKLVLKITSNFELRQIVKDSSNHPILITQNIWLNGVFLNGYFRGVWNNGVFKGFPKTTEMDQTQWIDGVFDGGHFISEEFYDDENRVFYNTGLIQNMTFNANNAGAIGKFSYQSWVDVIYSDQTKVNVNLETRNFSTKNAAVSSFLAKDGEIVVNTPNLSGFPIIDVLSSVSYFRDKDSSTIRKYNFGTKKTRYFNYIPEDGNFKRPFSSAIPKIGLSSFISNGWTYSFWKTGNSPVGLIVDSNTDTSNGGLLRIVGSAGSSVNQSSTNNNSIFYNQNTINTKPNRYYESVLILESNISGSNILALNITDDSTMMFNHETTTTLTKIEYFYNKSGNHIYFDVTGTNPARSSSIRNISFYEVDMIPLFRYATQSGIDLSIKSPYVGVAPIIDYTNNNFDFVENVDLGIDYKTINIQNSVVANKTLNGTSVPIEYKIQASGESAETDFGSGGGGPIQD